VTNQTVEIHIRGPNEFHDHVKAQFPEDDAHFHWTYMFPDEGTYTMAVVTELEAEETFEYTFEVEGVYDYYCTPARADSTSPSTPRTSRPSRPSSRTYRTGSTASPSGSSRSPGTATSGTSSSSTENG